MPRFIKDIIVSVLCSMPCLCFSQSIDTVYAGVTIRDEFTRESLGNAVLTVMDTDSTVLSVPVPKYRKNIKSHLFFCILPRREQYILRAEHKGYETGFSTLRFGKNETDKFADDILLRRSAIQLEEITVVGSKVLMVNRGDTIVYNASAFQLSNGSMLDALIHRLPGVELHPGGRITVNGKYVESLLINGRDFFRGDPKIALENLPAYYVDEVKVFHKTSLRRLVMYGDSIKASKQEDPYVMDVRLKRDYAEGWLGNAEAGHGTEDCYMARLFGMRYTNHSGLWAFGNVNNINNGQMADENGQWSGRLTDEGVVKTRTAGISFTGDDKKMLMKYGTSAKLTVTGSDNEQLSSSDNYYNTGNIFNRNHSQNSSKRTKASWEGKWQYGKTGHYASILNSTVSYTKAVNNGIERSASFLDKPYEDYRGAAIDSLYSPTGSQQLTELLLSQRERSVNGESDILEIRGRAMGMFKISGKWVDIDVAAYYYKQHEESWEKDVLRYGRTVAQPEQRLKRHIEQPNMSYDYRMGLNYSILNKNTVNGVLELRTAYEFHQRYDSGQRQLYRLDHSKRYATEDTGILPSATDPLQTVIDISNSFQTVTKLREHNISMDFQYAGFHVGLPVTWTNDRLTDNRGGKESRIARYRPYIAPVIGYSYMDISVMYTYSSLLPDMHYLLEVRDDSDPQILMLGNGSLSTTTIHQLSMDYKPRQTRGQTTFNAEQNLSLSRNAICMSRSYDLETGVTTIRPENINGNWSAWGSVSYGRPIGKDHRLRLTTTTDYRYHHSVDYSIIGGVPTSSKNTVHNLTVGETLKGEYRLRDWYVAATTHAGWRRATSPTENFLSVSAWDYNYGVSLTKPLLKDLDLNTELMMWSRRGYTDCSLNDDELIWNVSVSYAFGRLKQWIVKADGIDILRQRSCVRHTMNAQGRTETWYKTIPSYWMLRLMYQFKKAPRKR